MSINALHRIKVKCSGQKSRIVTVHDGNNIKARSKETDGWIFRNQGNSVRMVKWLRARDYGLGMLVLDMNGSLVTVRQKNVSPRWYCNGAKTVFQKFGRLWCLQCKTYPLACRPIPA